MTFQKQFLLVKPSLKLWLKLATGRPAFADDFHPENMLYAALLQAHMRMLTS